MAARLAITIASSRVRNVTRRKSARRDRRGSGLPAERREMAIALAGVVFPVDAEGMDVRARCPRQGNGGIDGMPRMDDRHRLRRIRHAHDGFTGLIDEIASSDRVTLAVAAAEIDRPALDTREFSDQRRQLRHRATGLA